MDIREITQLVRDALDMDRDPTRERAQLLFETYGTLWVAGHGEEALQRATELSAIGAASEDAEVKGWAVLRGADAKSLGTHNVDEVVAAYERAIMLLRQAHSPHLTWALHQAAWYTLWTWRHWDQAESMAAEWLSTSLAVGNDRDVGLAEQFIAWLAAAQRQTARAEAHAEIAAQTLRTIGNHREAALTSGVRAIAAAQRGNYSDALSQFAIHVTTIEVMGARSWLGGALLNRAAVAAAHDVATAREDVLRAGNLITATRQFEAAREFAYVAAMTVARAEPTLAATLVGAALDPKRDGGVRSDTLSMVVPATQQHGWDPTTDLDDRLGPRANARARSVWGYLDDRELIARTVHALRAPAPTI